MSGIDYEPLWNKSLRFIRKALQARGDGRFDDFCFWCTLAIELLGKAVLARIHPALVVNPQHTDSLFLACGKPLTSTLRTISGRTVFSRIARLSKEFDKTQVDFCELLANRRNAELHSGELPYTGLAPDSRAPRFWRAAELILRVGELDLDEWVGDTEAERVNELIASASTVLIQAVEA